MAHGPSFTSVSHLRALPQRSPLTPYHVASLNSLPRIATFSTPFRTVAHDPFHNGLLHVLRNALNMPKYIRKRCVFFGAPVHRSSTTLARGVSTLTAGTTRQRCGARSHAERPHRLVTHPGDSPVLVRGTVVVRVFLECWCEVNLCNTRRLASVRERVTPTWATCAYQRI